MLELIQKIAERWFLAEPVLFSIYCIQQLEENTQIACLFRCGKGRVEFNPNLTSSGQCNDLEIEELLRVEMIRILLKHPYERQPEKCLPEALTLSSNFVLDQHYRLRFANYLPAKVFQLPENQSFEWYAYKLDTILRQPGKKGEKGEADDFYSDFNENTNDWGTQFYTQRQQWADQSGLWEEDEIKQQEINEIIRNTTNWGTIPGDMVETILATLAVKLDYRKILSAFHTSILCSKRRLTRMRPSRRFGFSQMGSRYDLAARLLVAVDVSGSISSQTLAAFYSAIARFFKYGVHSIDAVQFDVGMREVETLRKATREVKVCGRGGTSFQAIFDYIKENPAYDGLIIFTDGYASEPQISAQLAIALRRTKVLWICPEEQEYNRHHGWMEKTGRACWMKIG